jgi:hypothetical protein
MAVRGLIQYFPLKPVGSPKIKPRPNPVCCAFEVPVKIISKVKIKSILFNILFSPLVFISRNGATITPLGGFA